MKTVFTACAAFLLLLAGSALAQEVVDRVAVVVNGEIVTLFEVNQRLGPVLKQFGKRKLTPAEEVRLDQMRKQILNQMVNDILIDQETERFGLTVKETEVENEIRSFKKRNGLTDDEFARQLKLQNKTREDFYKKMKEDILKHRLIGHMVQNKVVVTDAEIEAAYDAHKNDYAKDRKVSLSVIMVDDFDRAKNIAAEVKNGESTFAKAADSYSQGPGAGQGGNIGELAWKDMTQDWRDALSGLNPGEVSAPFAVNNMYILLMINKLDKGESQQLEEVREEIYNRLYNEKMGKLFDEYMTKLRDKAVIEYKM